MGKRGPRPKPTRLKLVQGERKDRINEDEPIPAPGEIVRPSWLNASAARVWAALAPDLEAKQLLTPWDVEQFANYCDAVVRRRNAGTQLDRLGPVLELPVFNKNGELTGHRIGVNPWHHIWKAADAQVRRYAQAFGLTPSDRSEVRPPGGKKKAAAARLLT